jgi:hypothetical protein
VMGNALGNGGVVKHIYVVWPKSVGQGMGLDPAWCGEDGSCGFGPGMGCNSVMKMKVRWGSFFVWWEMDLNLLESFGQSNPFGGEVLTQLQDCEGHVRGVWN